MSDTIKLIVNRAKCQGHKRLRNDGYIILYDGDVDIWFYTAEVTGYRRPVGGRYTV